MQRVFSIRDVGDSIRLQCGNETSLVSVDLRDYIRECLSNLLAACMESIETGCRRVFDLILVAHARLFRIRNAVKRIYARQLMSKRIFH